MWGYLLAGFVIMWLLQFYLTARQMKHYQMTVRRMSNREGGYLGVGVEKKKLGSGTVLVLVTNEEGIVEECRVMNGVTVFAKFKNHHKFTGKHISSLYDEKWKNPLNMAIEKIKQQMNTATTV
ncbi:transcriptional regulator GutM [Domibacillus sp. DTU_2020_1001157_1_SI_ALB_TIR_016]|uniref:transcriptional regulator GutM n=1 Tax=Domibacillus sp. DTU_2020_1001157_1_SI_ALB_TIR_016 TaxID=3077789 RepID=UPI0028EFF341|nr:transcriptional regulator GutM [Domibacillus sp. DTU_2020_1001157_1_SI_ALB_TIR_016]WNS78646.1 transcriptional regulator GutM [Domibacillus sp. DTU_2020_1001157_1_SI_ALB_TIR_016]